MTLTRTQLVQYRLAAHYLGKLKTAEATYALGHENSRYALALVVQDWSQIENWQHWSETACDDIEAARLCSQFPLVGYQLLTLYQKPEEVLDWLSAGLAAARKWQFHETKMKCLVRLARAYWSVADYEQATTCGLEGLRLAQALNDIDYEALAYNGLAAVARSKGEFAQAEAYYLKAQALCHRAGDDNGVAASSYMLSSIAGMQGQYDDALKFLDEALPIFRALGDLRMISNCLNNLGNIAFLKGETQSAISYMQECLEMKRAIGHRYGIGLALSNLGGQYAKIGEYEAARTSHEESIVVCQEIDDQDGILIGWRNLAEIDVALGEFDGASKKLLAGLAVAREVAILPSQLSILVMVVDYWQQSGRSELALWWARQLAGHPALEFENQQRLEMLFGAQLDGVGEETAVDVGALLEDAIGRLQEED